MAKREQIILLGKSKPGFNINETVGLGGQNKKGDVLLVQAMFNYIAKGIGADQLGIVAGSPFGLPQLSGKLDAETHMAIGMFQASNAKKLLNVDFVIHPASYRNRNINHFKPLMSITLLHVFARASAKMQGHSDYTIGMFFSMPNLLPWIDLNPYPGIGSRVSRALNP